jgi:hypothetical protein
MDAANEAKLQELRDLYLHETDEELERKRKVYLNFIVRATQGSIAEDAQDLTYNRRAHEELSAIVRQRRRSRARRETGLYVLQWLGFFGPYVLGILSSDYIKSLLGAR